MSITASQSCLTPNSSSSCLRSSHNQNLDSILNELIGRKNQLINLMKKQKSIQISEKESPKECRNYNKYEEKIRKAKWIIEENRLLVENSECKRMKLVMEIQQIEQQLIKESQKVKQLMQKQQTWIGGHESQTRLRLDLLQRENQVSEKGLGIRQILCEFYLKVQQLRGDLIYHDGQLEGDIVGWIVRNKLVNQLYGFIISKKQYQRHKNTIKYCQVISSDSDQQLVNSVKEGNNVKEGNSVKEGNNVKEGNSVKEGNNVKEGNSVKEGNNVKEGNSHVIWVNYMKILKKMQKKTNNSCTYSQFEGKLTQILTVQKRLKTKHKILTKQIKSLQQILSQANQDIQIKQQFIKDQYKKLNQSRQQQVKTMKTICPNPENKTHDPQIDKELGQIQQAIQYFTIKKQTSCKKQNKSANNMKSHHDVIGSPNRYNMLSPSSKFYTSLLGTTKLSYYGSPRNAQVHLTKGRSGKKVWK